MTSNNGQTAERLTSAFTTNLTQLLNDILDGGYQLGDKRTKIMAFRIAVESDYLPEQLMEQFGNFVLPFKEQIQQRDLAFFTGEQFSNHSVFNQNPSAISSWKAIFVTNLGNSKDDTENFFAYFDRLIKCCENYKKLKR
jgi:hypothetical protein